MEKQITLTLEQTRELYGKNPEMDKLLLANFTKDDLIKKELPKTWSELEKIDGYYLEDGQIKEAIFDTTVKNYYRHRFYNQKEAKSALAMAQLSQLMAVYNDGWVPDWENDKDCKYVIFRGQGPALKVDSYYYSYNYLAFKSFVIRNEFLLNFRDLIKDYLMMK